MSFERLFNGAACKGAKCEKPPPFLFGLQWAADTVGDRTHVILAPSCRANVSPTNTQFVSTATGCLVRACRKHRAKNATKQSGLGAGWNPRSAVHKQPFSRKSLTFRVCKCPVHLVSPNHCCFARPIFLYELAPQRMALLSSLPTHSLT